MHEGDVARLDWWNTTSSMRFSQSIVGHRCQLEEDESAIAYPRCLRFDRLHESGFWGANMPYTAWHAPVAWQEYSWVTPSSALGKLVCRPGLKGLVRA